MLTLEDTHDHMVCVSIRASPNLDILGMKFHSKLTLLDHVSGIVSRVSQRIGILRLVKRLFVDTCITSVLFCICSPVSWCRTYKFARPFLPAQVRMWNSLPYAVFDTLAEPWMGWRVQSTVGCFPELCCLQFFVAQVLVGLRKQLLNNFIFPTWACAAGFNNNINLLFHIGLQAIANYGPTHKGYEDLIG